ncbi:MAG TPA: mucoidy inhibitor MuiA family protein [Syntrophales bacterium]|nr:mucoidy inhibitor MuiA family protein [Syntrophales bacterium]
MRRKNAAVRGGLVLKRMGLAVALGIVLCGGAAASSAELEPASSIRGVVVYPDSAMIRKQAVFSAPRGQSVIRIAGITADMVDASVQASLSGAAGVKIADVKVEKTFLSKTSQERAENLKQRLEDIEEKIKGATNDAAVLNSAIDLLKKIVPFPQNQKVTPAEVDAHVKFVARSLTENYGELAKAEARLKKLQEEKRAVERELKNVTSRKDESKSIVVSVFAQNEARQAALALSYLVGGAGWSPAYDVRADSGARVGIDCYATLRQSTGEDWKGVDMEISTAKPFVYGVPPELPPWFVDIYQPRPAARKSVPGRDADELRPMMLEMERKSEAAQAAGYEEPEVKAETSSFSFVMPRRVDVPSDGQPHRILIASAGRDAGFSYYGVPKLSRYAYLRADLKNPFTFPLIEGPMTIFLDDRLVGTAAVEKAVLPGEDMKLSLGVDEGIKMERKLLRKFTESAGAFVKDTRVQYEFGIDLLNGKGREISLTVNDGVPVSRNEKIKVEIESPGKGEAKISEDGILAWDLKLAGGEKKSLKVRFSVTFPRDVRITGLE